MEEYAADEFESSGNHEPLQSEAAIVAQSASGVAEPACDDKDDLKSFQTEGPNYNPWGKRSISPNQDGGQTKRPRYDPATLRERPEQSHQSAGIGFASQEQQLPGMRNVNALPSYDDIHNHGYQLNATTTGLFTPTSTMQYGHASQSVDPVARPQWSSHNFSHGGLDSPPPTMLEHKDVASNQAQDDSGSDGYWLLPPPSDSNDEYPIDSENENDMLRLLDSAEAYIETHIPPSSVLNPWDRDSRSADVYDENLQHSPLQPATDLCDDVEKYHTATGKDDLLDEDVDWDAVYAISTSIPKNTSLAGSLEREEPCTEGPAPAPAPAHEQGQELPCDGVEDGLQPPTPFQRYQFPEKVHDRSVIRGLSSEVVLRTCFRIEELLEQDAHCYNHHQNVVFELYAKVKYSNREELARKDYLVLADLFEDHESCLLGTFSRWRAGDPKDQQSQAFLGVKSYKMCRCMCKAKRDSDNETGWVLDILDIRETDWDGIRFAKMIIGEDNCESADEQLMAPWF
ncbi:hypothetical protein PG996_013149 [Apiospora saccharicola]|uniref:Uncharacterized protein n=1 Tax=Apiospora saccharicola TaxID=335842 RepID=A0ABR1U4M7_9PEZI